MEDKVMNLMGKIMSGILSDKYGADITVSFRKKDVNAESKDSRQE